MRFVKQTESDNCFSACLSAALDYKLKYVPNFYRISGDEEFYEHVESWLAERGYHLRYFSGRKRLRYPAIMIVKNKKIVHAVISLDGKIIFDPAGCQPNRYKNWVKSSQIAIYDIYKKDFV